MHCHAPSKRIRPPGPGFAICPTPDAWGVGRGGIKWAKLNNECRTWTVRFVPANRGHRFTARQKWHCGRQPNPTVWPLIPRPATLFGFGIVHLHRQGMPKRRDLEYGQTVTVNVCQRSRGQVGRSAIHQTKTPGTSRSTLVRGKTTPDPIGMERGPATVFPTILPQITTQPAMATNGLVINAQAQLGLYDSESGDFNGSRYVPVPGSRTPPQGRQSFSKSSGYCVTVLPFSRSKRPPQSPSTSRGPIRPVGTPVPMRCAVANDFLRRGQAAGSIRLGHHCAPPQIRTGPWSIPTARST